MKEEIALVLSGGGARGIAHIGVIEELLDHGYKIGSIAGTSMGALVGGMHALGKLEEYKKWMISLDKVKVLSLVDFSFSTQGLVKGDRVFNKMREFISDENIEDLDIPFAAVAVDLIKPEEKVFISGSIYDAIRASVSIPTVFTPIQNEDALFVDGGVLNNIPVDHVIRKKNDLLVVVDVNAPIPPINFPKQNKKVKKEQTLYKKQLHRFQNQLQKILPTREEKMTYFNLINLTISTMTHQISEMKLKEYSPDCLVEISRESSGLFDFYKAQELVELGRIVTRKALKENNLDSLL